MRMALMGHPLRSQVPSGRAAPIVATPPAVRPLRPIHSTSSHKQNPHVQQQTQPARSPELGHEKGFGGAHRERGHSPVAHVSSGAGQQLLQWLQENGAPEQAVTLKSVEPPSVGTPSPEEAAAQQAGGKFTHTAPHNRPIDMVVARKQLNAGDVALRIPERLVICLERIFENEFVAELLTTDKLSELACLSLYLMYEKKLREDSFWFPYIKELDRQRARGTQAVESPLLWEPAELEDLLQGSPLLAAVKQRLQGIKREYEELDTVWYMSKSLFSKYPFDLPTETFSFERFKQAFSAVQACIIHLQGVPPSRRFALVPLGPPLLTYSSTSKGMLVWEEATRSVVLVADRPYEAGEPVMAWCGPQPNSRLLLNYGIVDEHNPYDKLQITTILGTNDPLFQAKRAALQAAGLSTSQVWNLERNKPLPAQLLPFLRLGAADTAEAVQQVSFDANASPSAPETEALIRGVLSTHLKSRLAAYKRTMEEDLAISADPHASPRRKVAARLTKIEKSILQSALDQLAGADQKAAASLPFLKLT